MQTLETPEGRIATLAEARRLALVLAQTDPTWTCSPVREPAGGWHVEVHDADGFRVARWPAT
jgi:hypothetical protein